MNNIINIAAAIITNNRHEILLVRKKNSSFFMQAGGKIEQGETAVQALTRELQEELQLTIKAEQSHYVGEYLVPAANEINYYIKASLFTIFITDTHFLPQAELEEVSWYSIEQAKSLMLAPLTKDIILPFIEKTKPTI